MNNNHSDLFEQFVRLEWLLHRYHQQNHKYHGPMGDTYRGQGRVLALLKLKPEISQKELSNILDIRSQSLGELLTKLEKSGYITRTPSETDRRVMDIHLTEEGKQAAEQPEQQLDSTELFGCLNEEEQAAFSDYLNRIISALEQQLGDGDSVPDPHRHHHFGERGFGMFPQMGGRPPFDGRDFGHRPDMEDARWDFHDNRNYGHSEDENYPDGPNKE